MTTNTGNKLLGNLITIFMKGGTARASRYAIVVVRIISRQAGMANLTKYLCDCGAETKVISEFVFRIGPIRKGIHRGSSIRQSFE